MEPETPESSHSNSPNNSRFPKTHQNPGWHSIQLQFLPEARKLARRFHTELDVGNPPIPRRRLLSPWTTLVRWRRPKRGGADAGEVVKRKWGSRRKAFRCEVGRGLAQCNGRLVRSRDDERPAIAEANWTLHCNLFSVSSTGVFVLEAWVTA